MIDIDFSKLGPPAPYTLTTPVEMDSKKTFEYVMDSRFIKGEVRISDKVPNTDGIIEITNEEQIPIGKLEIQLKTLDKSNLDSPKYQCEKSFIAYCRDSILAVILVVADNQNNCVYWRHIDEEAIDDARSRLKGETVSITIPIENKITRGTTDYVSKWIQIVQSVKRKLTDPETKQRSAIIDFNEKFTILRNFIIDINCGHIDENDNAAIDNYIKKFEIYKNDCSSSEANFKLLVEDVQLVSSAEVLFVTALLTWQIKNIYLFERRSKNIELEIFTQNFRKDMDLMIKFFDIKKEMATSIKQFNDSLSMATDILEQKFIEFQMACKKTFYNPNETKQPIKALAPGNMTTEVFLKCT
ncbi:DUF4365 domain-containing protein [Longitalea luteola]|uniref:DUF4365 domain-containing protein n=1 Tax=Longitalea luteola TaxID=2812563 RepID=UPI001A963E9D|nr:DUF4365 domain-containing protein [Longitalea luteola]